MHKSFQFGRISKMLRILTYEEKIKKGELALCEFNIAL